MRFHSIRWLSLGAVVVAGTVLSGSAGAANILPLFVNTGRDATNTGNLASGATDTRYTLFSVPSGPSTSLTMTPHSAWLNHTTYTDSKWIGPRELGASQSSPAGLYKYSYSFDLTGYDASTVAVGGRWATDNTAVMYLNGVDTSINTSGTQFSAWKTFTLPASSALFQNGVNTLEFWVTNAAGSSGNPTGLRVEWTSATATPVPEPMTATLAALALGAAARRRRRQRIS